MGYFQTAIYVAVEASTGRFMIYDDITDGEREVYVVGAHRIQRILRGVNKPLVPNAA